MLAQLVPALPWLAPLLGLHELAFHRPSLATFPCLTGERVSVIVPARNEAASIDNLLSSLIASEYPDLEILVVDDRSTDDTAERVALWAARDDRIRLIQGRELPPGWFGKPWACVQGAEQANGTILVFTDADTTHSPSLLGRTVAAIRQEQIDLLSVATRIQCVTFWERIVMPQVFAILGLRFAPRRVNRSRTPWGVAANGQYLVLPRTSYLKQGGHTAVFDQVVEDIALAQHCIRSGGKLRFYHAESLISTRMYRSLAEMIEGWSKNIHLGSRMVTPPGILRFLAPFGVMLAMIFWLIPPLTLLLGLAGPASLWAVLASLLFWGVVLFGMRLPVWYALLYPLGSATTLGIVLRSIWRGKRKVVWRGRSYHPGDQGSPHLPNNQP